MPNKDVIIVRENASFMRLIIQNEGIREDFYHFFRFKDPKFQESRWRKGNWDGTVRMFNKMTGKLPYGLLQIVLKLCQKRGYSYELDPEFSNDISGVTREEIKEFIDGLKITDEDGIRIDAYDYQVESVYLSVKYNRMTLLAATSAGKSLILYCLIRWYHAKREDGLNNGKTLLIVPSIHLTKQMFSDFKDYSQMNGWDVNRYCHIISESAPVYANKPVYIATWQGIRKQQRDYFEQFGQVFVDEAHGASADCIKGICENSIYADQRVGLTGTLDNVECHKLQVQGSFGPVIRVVTTKQLQDAGRASKTLITRLRLEYPLDEREIVVRGNYTDEIDYLMAHPVRNKVLIALANSLKGNVLMLFERKDAHQLRVYAQMIEGGTKKKVFIVNGDVLGDDRVAIQKIAEAEQDVVILGSYKTLSTGVSIKNLHHLIFCHPKKSVITVLQSIGRLLRLHKSKEIANIYDVYDVFETRGMSNITMTHAEDRLGYYMAESHPVVERVFQVGKETAKPVGLPRFMT